jgi:ABC-type nickel/cobalt efflux system permease component RcnA
VEAEPEEERTPGRAGLWVMGLVGGLVPSPSALLLLLAAVALGKAWFGIAVVVGFGLGMAATLAFVGIVARDLVLRLERLAAGRGLLGGPVRTVLAYGAATSVCGIGGIIVVRTALGLAS